MNTQKTVVITGGSAGIGRAIANEFAKTGAKILLIARGIERLEQAKAQVENFGGKALIFLPEVFNYNELSS